MSLFIRMTQSRAGAERLLEAQLLPILAQCDYLDTRPEADQAFIGRRLVSRAAFSSLTLLQIRAPSFRRLSSGTTSC